jgi:AcrR family transcriptional regulator
VAEAEGWDAVTTRRLSTEIEYSQPVLYKHFAGMDEIAEAVAIEGFGELADALRTARVNAATAEHALTQIAHTYLEFARNNPALYDAMFTRATTMRFAVSDTPPPARAGFAELHEAVSAVAHGRDVDTFAEVFWAARLDHSGPFRPSASGLRLRTRRSLGRPVLAGALRDD